MATRFLGRPLAAALLLGLGLCSCGGGSNGAAAAADLNGYWMVYLTPTGGSNETGPTAIQLAQSGTTLDGVGITGSVNGSAVTINSDAVVFQTVFTGTVNGNTASGSFTITGIINTTGTFRLQKFTPTGTMTVSGTMQSNPISITSAVAAGSRDYSDVALTALDEVEIIAMQSGVHLEIDFSAAGMSVGSLGVPSAVTAAVTYRVDGISVEYTVTSGTATITQYDNSGFAGSYTMTLSSGDTLTGTFNVNFDINAYDP